MKAVLVSLTTIALGLVNQMASAATLIFSGTIDQVDVRSYPGVTAGDAYQLRVDYVPTFIVPNP